MMLSRPIYRTMEWQCPAIDARSAPNPGGGKIHVAFGHLTGPCHFSVPLMCKNCTDLYLSVVS